ncbi:tonB-system energizer ExbB [Pseudomonas sp. BMS12]|uniref:tonB-system energizer ExbB n=1 Tax=Pseudomonas sp. BMS12 TaxID=1796033 RepID=UPI00083AE49F|nr:tonB-system energizer ExbB [Pseudomonas sp. BMS12]
MNSTALRAQPTLAPRLTLAAMLLGLLLPFGAFAEEAALARPEAVASSEQVQPAAAEPQQDALLQKLQALGPQATPEQLREAARQHLTEAGASTEEITKTLQALDSAATLGQDLSKLLAGENAGEAVVAEDQTLLHDLSPMGMYRNADMVVKSVMIGLVLASILTWTVWIAKGLELIIARRRLQREVPELKAARNLAQAAEQARAKHSFSSVLIEDARDELRLSAGSQEKEGIKERVSFRLERLVAASGRSMSQGTGVLATIGSTAPFVGLFGTVWGIMNSFIGIAKSQTTNLAVVAPGIAEALLATALGLVAAIPAVIIYNVFARSIAGYRAQVADASAQVLLLVSRDLDLPAAPERNQQPHVAKVG